MVIRLLWNNKRIWIFSNWNCVNHKVRLAHWNEHFLIMKEIFVLFIIVVLYSNQFFSGSLPLIKLLLISKYFNGFFFWNKLIKRLPLHYFMKWMHTLQTEQKAFLYNLKKFSIHSFVNKDFIHFWRIDVLNMIFQNNLAEVLFLLDNNTVEQRLRCLLINCLYSFFNTVPNHQTTYKKNNFNKSLDFV